MKPRSDARLQLIGVVSRALAIPAPEARFSGWLRIGLTAGTIAISVNTGLLKAADWMHVDIGHGGLLELVREMIERLADSDSAPAARRLLSLPVFATPSFKIGFHAVIGLLMALFYTRVMEPLLLPQRLAPWVKGSVYALLLWMANAAIVLPALGQGFAGSRALSIGGLLYFAFAHTVFFLILAWVTAVLRPPPGPFLPR